MKRPGLTRSICDLKPHTLVLPPAPTKGEGADDSALSIIEFGHRAGAVAFEFFDLWKVCRIYEKQSAGSAHRDGEQDEQPENNYSQDLPSANFYSRKMLIDDFQSRVSRLQSLNI